MLSRINRQVMVKAWFEFQQDRNCYLRICIIKTLLEETVELGVSHCSILLFQVLEVFDENRLTRDDFLGMVELPLNNLPKESEDRQVPHKFYILRPRSARSKVKGHLQVKIIGIFNVMASGGLYSLIYITTHSP